jgi:hypothetical protein
MAYIVLETFGGAEHAAIVTDEDGNNKVFQAEKEAGEEADLCQEGIVVKL